MSIMNCVDCGKPVDTDVDDDYAVTDKDDTILCGECCEKPSDKPICILPDCNKKIPYWRAKKKRITCCHKCSTNWNHISSRVREKIRGKKYGE